LAVKTGNTIPLYRSEISFKTSWREEEVTKDFYQEVIDHRERMLAAKEEADALEKRRVAKEKTVECRFWKQQQLLGKLDKTDRKVLEHCTLDYVAPEADSPEGKQQQTN
jgi:hypothetical protein